MKEDIKEGWWHAPSEKECNYKWKCPDCNKKSSIGKWIEHRVPCEDCGDHDGREYPECGMSFDHVWGSIDIRKVTMEESYQEARMAGWD